MTVSWEDALAKLAIFVGLGFLMHKTAPNPTLTGEAASLCPPAHVQYLSVADPKVRLWVRSDCTVRVYLHPVSPDSAAVILDYGRFERVLLTKEERKAGAVDTLRLTRMGCEVAVHRHFLTDERDCLKIDGAKHRHFRENPVVEDWPVQRY